MSDTALRIAMTLYPVSIALLYALNPLGFVTFDEVVVGVMGISALFIALMIPAYLYEKKNVKSEERYK